MDIMFMLYDICINSGNNIFFHRTKEDGMELGSLVLTICAGLMAVVICLGIFASRVYK